jgi:sulfur relay (sulfurtransferase) complex TusBCD TusD component (DsrE family)
MGKLLIILFSSPIQFQNIDTAYEFAKAAIKEGHKVSIFFDIDSIYGLQSSQILPNQTMPAKKLVELIEKGVYILACRESARLRGIDLKKQSFKGVKESSLAELAQLIEESNRVVAFGF